MREKYPNDIPQRICPICQRSFYPLRQQIKNNTGYYCSPSCWYISNTKPLSERFWSKVRKEEGAACWLWIGARFKGPREYGLLGNEQKEPRLAHRISWELNRGPIPTGMQVLHTCDNPPCVRPDHLFLGTQKDNMQDMISKGRNAPQRDPTRHARGEQHGRAKLTEDIIREIRTRYEAGGISQSALAKEYDLGQSHISRILLRQVWQHC